MLAWLFHEMALRVTTLQKRLRKENVGSSSKTIADHKIR